MTDFAVARYESVRCPLGIGLLLVDNYAVIAGGNMGKIGVVFLLMVVSMAGCSKSDESDVDTESESSEPLDTESETESESESEDTGESEIPPDIPALCSGEIVHQEASGSGNSRIPAVANIGDNSLIAWGRDSQEGSAQEWAIQVAPWTAGDTVIDPLDPLAPGVISNRPALASNEQVFGMVWLEGRTEWDPSCLADAPLDCQQSLVFMTFDEAALPEDAMPVQIVEPFRPAGPPALVSTASGWMAFWQIADGTGATIWAVPLDENGDPGEMVQISQTEAANPPAYLSAAAIGDKVIVMWLTADQQVIEYQMMNDSGTLDGETRVLEEGISLFGPHVVAGDGEFMVSYARTPYEDSEIFTVKIDMDGEPIGDLHRITWTTRRVTRSHLSYSDTAGYGITWVSSQVNGSEECIDEECDNKTFASVLDSSGALASEPVFLTVGNEDMNPESNMVITFDGQNWLVLWETRRNLRQQIHYGVMSCTQ